VVGHVAWLLFLGRQPRIGFDPIGGGGAEPGLRGSDGGNVALTGLHVQPRLAVGDVSAIVMFRQDDSIVCHIHPAPDHNAGCYGVLICDLVRHVAAAFKVDEDDVREWVDRERQGPTTEITQPS
jgi:hypothetical protein